MTHFAVCPATNWLPSGNRLTHGKDPINNPVRTNCTTQVVWSAKPQPYDVQRAPPPGITTFQAAHHDSNTEKMQKLQQTPSHSAFVIVSRPEDITCKKPSDRFTEWSHRRLQRVHVSWVCEVLGGIKLAVSFRVRTHEVLRVYQLMQTSLWTSQTNLMPAESPAGSATDGEDNHSICPGTHGQASMIRIHDSLM